MTLETTVQVQPGQAEALLRALAQWLPARAGDPLESLPRGIHEWRDGADCWVSFLRGPDNLWAIRWDQVCPRDLTGEAPVAEGDLELAQAFKPRIRCEACFVPSAAHGALAALAVYGPADDWSQALVAKWGGLPGIVRGRRRMFDLHLAKGGGRDERYCLRIYFFWSAEDRKVVVGWLPSHLSNSLS